MLPLTRREILGLFGLAGFAGGSANREALVDIHRQLLEHAAKFEQTRRERFRAVSTPGELTKLQNTLKKEFLSLFDGLPEPAAVPKGTSTGRLKGEGYSIEKLLIESFPGYFVSALLYRPEPIDRATPAILFPCGHSTVGKAEDAYQILHINLAKRGYAVLAYDPVGQGERSQFWNAKQGRSRFNLSCGEHAVLGNPLYLLGTNLARYRIWDGIRALDYLCSLPEIDADRIGCVGNSGGGTLTSYISAVDQRVKVPVIGCYITTLPRRMNNRIQDDPSADPEQDLYGFIARGIDHAGLLAMLAPRPTLICAAKLDFFPIEGTRETFAEAKHSYRVAGFEERIEMVEAPLRHGLNLPLREATYAWFDRWLGLKKDRAASKEIPVKTRTAAELRVSTEGQVNVSMQSRPLLSIALESFKAQPKRKRVPLESLLGSKLDEVWISQRDLSAAPHPGAPLLLCINGNESPAWADDKRFISAAAKLGFEVKALDPRGVGVLRVPIASRGGQYADPLSGVEENVAYNAFLVGETLLAIRVADVRAAVSELAREKRPIVLCGRGDSALVACLAAAIEPQITKVVVEDMWLSFLPLFDLEGQPINAASILPGLLRDFGDVAEILGEIAPRPVYVAAPRGSLAKSVANVTIAQGRFTSEPDSLAKWLAS